MNLFYIILAFVLISSGLAWYLISFDRGEKEPVSALWLALGFGFVGGIVAAIIERKLISPSDIAALSPIRTIFFASIIIGVVEEACKFIPMAIFIYPKKYFNEHTDGIIYFAIVGLGFGLPENILYTIHFGTKTGLSRMFLTPFFHAAITAMVGYFFIKSKLAKKSWLRVIPVLLIAMLLHGLYDFGLASNRQSYAIGSIIITLSLSLMLFLLYTRATDLDQRLGKSIVGKNNYCRNCGQPNPKHHLYCVHCGQRA